MDSKDIGLKTFLHENQVETIIDIESELLYKYEKEQIDNLMRERPWKKDPHYFKSVKISVIALIKMLTHAKSGGNIEVMGIMQGKVYPNTMVIMDVFSLPVEGTETRVNAASEANEYMIDYLTKIKEVGRLENAIGWYHSHPGYGCWLSGIDVSTQTMNQSFQDPFLAVVVDPIRTLSTGKVELGAFRTYPEDFTPPESSQSEDTSIPLNKVEDFGVHHSKYYPVKVTYFKSQLENYIIDQLWSQYWIETLTKSSLFVNRQYHTNQLNDLSTKFQRLDSYSVFHDMGRFDSKLSTGSNSRSNIDKVTDSANLINGELSQGLMSQMIKSTLFPQKD